MLRWSVGAAVGSALALGAVSSATAQQPQTDEPAPSHWAAGCVAPSRGEPLDCAIEQRVVNSRGGQILALARIRVSGTEKSPAMLIRVPLGTYLPAKLSLSIDGVEKVTLDFQSCDREGCYAGSPLGDDLLAAMRQGDMMELALQSLDRQAVPISISLMGFGEAYESIM